MAGDVATFLGEKLPEGKALTGENVILCKERQKMSREDLSWDPQIPTHGGFQPETPEGETQREVSAAY